MPTRLLLTLRRPLHGGPTHNSESWLIATHYHVEDLHLLLFAGFYRRFLGVPLFYLPSPSARVLDTHFEQCVRCPVNSGHSEVWTSHST